MPNVRVSDEQYAQLKNLKKQHGITIQAAVRRALDYWLDDFSRSAQATGPTANYKMEIYPTNPEADV